MFELERNSQFFRKAKCFLAVVLSCCWCAFAMVVPAFADDDWNPSPSDGDILLPLPCDQTIVFTRVITEQGIGSDQSSLLDDRRILLGWPNEDNAFLDYLRSDFIAGHFFDGDIRYYLVGKYEVTRAQYNSVMADDCEWPEEGTYLPVVNISWFDAIEFSRRLTGYLLREQNEAFMDATSQSDAFVRLPTEAEWEYAARGGQAVSLAEFQGTRFPGASQALPAYAWFNGPESAQGDLYPVGILLPNQIGIYDVYGNASEMMFDSFRLNKAGRMHGMAGGFIAKGGSFIENRSFTRSSFRNEFSYFQSETNQETKAKFLGVRLVIAGPAIPSREEYDQILEDWEMAAQSPTPIEADPIELLDNIESEQSDLQLTSEIEAVKQAVRAELGAINEARSRLLNALFLSSAQMTVDIRTLYQRVKDRSLLLESDLVGSLSASKLSQLREDTRADADRIQDLNYFNHEILVTIANEYSEEEISRQSEQVVGDISQRGLDSLAGAARIAGAISGFMSRGELLNREDVLKNTVTGL